MEDTAKWIRDNSSSSDRRVVAMDSQSLCQALKSGNRGTDTIRSILADADTEVVIT